MKMMAIIEVGMMVIAALLLMLIGQFTPSSAQAGCWDRIAACLSDAGAEDMNQCCSVLTLEITNDKECFCTIKPVLDGNVTLGRAFSAFFSLCEITSSFEKLCSGIYFHPLLYFLLVSSFLNIHILAHISKMID